MSDDYTDEWHEGYAAFQFGEDENPYIDFDKYLDWEEGWLAAQLDWYELVGVSV